MIRDVSSGSFGLVYGLPESLARLPLDEIEGISMLFGKPIVERHGNKCGDRDNENLERMNRGESFSALLRARFRHLVSRHVVVGRRPSLRDISSREMERGFGREALKV